MLAWLGHHGGRDHRGRSDEPGVGLYPGSNILLTNRHCLAQPVTHDVVTVGKSLLDEWRRIGVLIPGESMGHLMIPQSTYTHADDYDCSGIADFFYYDAFVADFEAGNPAADANRDGFNDFADCDAFLAAFEGGC
jgi:hypothetical protein